MEKFSHRDFLKICLEIVKQVGLLDKKLGKYANDKVDENLKNYIRGGEDNRFTNSELKCWTDLNSRDEELWFFIVFPSFLKTWFPNHLRINYYTSSRKLCLSYGYSIYRADPIDKLNVTTSDKKNWEKISGLLNENNINFELVPYPGGKYPKVRFWNLINFELRNNVLSKDVILAFAVKIVELNELTKKVIKLYTRTDYSDSNLFMKYLSYCSDFNIDNFDFSGVNNETHFIEISNSSEEFEEGEASLNSKSITRNSRSIEEKLEEYQKKLETGFSGEEFVFNSENELVSSRKLGYEVVWESQFNDSSGYDIQSWDEKGNKIYIEVKSTTIVDNTSFFMSKNELEVAHKMQDSYYIYVVYIGDDGPQILEKIKNPAKEANYSPLNYNSDGILTLEPVSFKVSKRL